MTATQETFQTRTQTKVKKFTKKLSRWEVENLTLRFSDLEMENFSRTFPGEGPHNILLNHQPLGKRNCNFETQTLALGLGLRDCRPGDTLIFQPSGEENGQGETILIFSQGKSLNVQERFSQTYLKVRDLIHTKELAGENPMVETLVYLMNENKHLLEENARLHRELDQIQRDQERVHQWMIQFNQQPLLLDHEELLGWLKGNLHHIDGELHLKRSPFIISGNSGISELKKPDLKIDILGVSGKYGLCPIHVIPAKDLTKEKEVFSVLLKIKEIEEALGSDPSFHEWGVQKITSFLFTPTEHSHLIEKCLVNGIKLICFKNGFSLDFYG